MKTKLQNVKFLFVLSTLFAVIACPFNSYASHSWNGYHWARTANPFTLKVVDSNTPDWDDNQARARSDWSASTILNLGYEAGDDSSRARKRCVMIAGKIHSCNAAYGINGWLGLASININGSHITQGSAKMNDSYFGSGSYTETNRQQVMCQEIGHTFGLDHQSTSGADLNTCMDYSNALDNPSPNQHDYDELLIIYQHLDSTSTIGFAALRGSSANEVTNDPNTWGKLSSQSADGRSSTYEREHYDGSTTATHVFWVAEVAERCPACDHRNNF